MKIAIVCGDDVGADPCGPECGGAVAGDCGQLCAGLAAHGHDVTAFVRRRLAFSDIATERGYRTVAVTAGPVAAIPPAQVLPYLGDWAAELAAVWSADPPDVVHALGWLGGLAAQLAAKRQRLPTVQSFYDLTTPTQPDRAGRHPDGSERARLESLLVRNATWVTAGSSADVGALARLRRTRARLSVLSAGVDVEHFTPVGPALARTDLHRIVSVAPDPSPDSGFDTTIRALPTIPAAELVIAESAAAGSRHREARRALENLAAELRVSNRVRVAGPVAADELPALLRSADVVACTPRQAPRAGAALQAMASGVAVVAVSTGALADTVVHSVTGLLVPPDNPRELAIALKTLQGQTFQCAGMGAAGRLRAVSRFTWDRIALDALNIYRQLSSPVEQQPVANAR
ncbi:glycosyltransferase [Mycobacterium pseudokansasii]|uniref:glycosyltransferase n=1 Tax=Mycobacterium pseudokansasii TaxID=2341080 RepID=UPI0007B5112D|nr:glycosyltransferase [Mycobacterium pseudokansasii]KZS66209.1 glycosyl transferase family 1 [Mycobacterium kansasii]VBA33385.1 GDP-mannose-dependent alpha-(1-6)-phosphatidylinositol monomannoside mannosyltransferase [Mycobacterium pseudokansasii]VBA34954.1 GDP-mannose-dependent alpha-(1-6)-phosphatidylinositol monomannoside mannosyltransferase [Mycobacterium pseudokansasii]